MSNEKNPGCLGYTGDYITQLYRDYSKPLQGSLLTNQYNGKYEGFFVAQMSWVLVGDSGSPKKNVSCHPSE